MKTIFAKTSVVWVALAIFTLNMSSCKDELPKIIEEGITGSLSWKLTDDGILTISGLGEMLDYRFDFETRLTNTPWYPYQDIIKTVIIDNGITSIGDWAFYSCSSLKTITIPNSVTSIGNQAFACCYSLTDITLPNSITNIVHHTFAYCSGLTEITIPNSVEYIGHWAFYECSGLKTVVIGNGIIEIGERAFYACSALMEMTVKAVTPPYCIAGHDIFRGVQNIPVYVPQGSLQTYKNASVWGRFNLQGKVF